MQNKILRETIYPGVFIALIVFLALPASAQGATLAELRDQIAQLRARIATMQQTQTSAPPSGSIMTPRPTPGQSQDVITMDTTFTRNLARGSRGDDVRTLQQFLIAQNLLSPASATGFFGLLTEGAVKNFQALRGIVSSGSPLSTGWGSVGPRTRAVLEESSVPGTKPPTPTTKPPSGSLSCATPDLAPLYELFEPRTKKHFYTTSESEQRRFISDLGYADRGVVAYVYDREMSGTAPLQRFKSDSTEDRIYTTKPDTAKLNSEGYRFEKIEGHLYTTQESGSLPFAQYSFVGQQDHWYSIDETLATTFASLGAVSEGAQGYACPGAPHISDNTILSLAGATTVISGLGFADNSANPFRDDYVVTFVGGGNTITISSLDSRVLMWNSRTIKLRTPSGLDSGYSVRVTAGGYGTSNTVPVRVYAYSSYPSHSPENSKGHLTPLDVALDKRGNLWVEAEFSRGIESIVTATGQNVYYKDVQPANPIFYIDPQFSPTVYGETDISLSNQDVDVAQNGDIWYGQGGDAYTQKGATRIVQLTPGAGTQRCYNIPQDGAGISGVLVDEATGTVYAGSIGQSREKGNFILSFKPSTFTETQASCAYDFVSPYPAPWCTQGETGGCFEKYPVPQNNAGAAHVEKGPDGNIWFTEFYGTAIGMLNPATKKITEYPMPKATHHPAHIPAWNKVGSGPWQLGFDSKGNLWVNEYFESAFVKFDIAKARGGGCTKLDGDGNNPCAVVTSLIYYPLSNNDNEYVHTIDIDSQDRVWFAAHTYPMDKGLGFLGMVDKTGEIQMFPPLADLGITGGAAGITVDDKSGDIWFAEFWAQKIGRLTFIP